MLGAALLITTPDSLDSLHGAILSPQQEDTVQRRSGSWPGWMLFQMGKQVTSRTPQELGEEAQVTKARHLIQALLKEPSNSKDEAKKTALKRALKKLNEGVPMQEVDQLLHELTMKTRDQVSKKAVRHSLKTQHDKHMADDVARMAQMDAIIKQQEGTSESAEAEKQMKDHRLKYAKGTQRAKKQKAETSKEDAELAKMKASDKSWMKTVHHVANYAGKAQKDTQDDFATVGHTGTQAKGNGDLSTQAAEMENKKLMESKEAQKKDARSKKHHKKLVQRIEGTDEKLKKELDAEESKRRQSVGTKNGKDKKTEAVKSAGIRSVQPRCFSFGIWALLLMILSSL